MPCGVTRELVRASGAMVRDDSFGAYFASICFSFCPKDGTDWDSFLFPLSKSSVVASLMTSPSITPNASPFTRSSVSNHVDQVNRVLVFTESSTLGRLYSTDT